MLNDLLPKVPPSYGRYIEPFFGGGALFFALQPENAIIADSNPELINMYRQVANNLDNVIKYLKQYENTKEMFYNVRSQKWEGLISAEAAARTIFLNRTCFNGLYRVNKKVELSKIIMRLHERGCHIILTNSNHPLVHKTSAMFTIDVAQARCYIFCCDNIWCA